MSFFSSSDSYSQGISTGLDYQSYTTNLYTEIGLPWRMTFIMNLPYVVATNTAQSGAHYQNHTFGDSQWELDVSLLDRIPLSLGVQVKVPLYQTVYNQSDGGVVRVDDLPWPATNFPDVGDGNVDLTSKVLFGHSFYPAPAWLTSELGYRVRFDGYADGIYANFNVGGYVWPDHLILGLYTDGIINVQKDPDPSVQASREYLYVQGSMTITAAPWQPQLGLTLSGGYIPVARNSSRGWDLGLSLSYSH